MEHLQIVGIAVDLRVGVVSVDPGFSSRTVDAPAHLPRLVDAEATRIFGLRIRLLVSFFLFEDSGSVGS